MPEEGVGPEEAVRYVGSILEGVEALLPELRRLSEGQAAATEKMVRVLREVTLKAAQRGDTQAFALVLERARRLLGETEEMLRS